MISDWSGAALDYAFGLNKPVVFIDVPKKINNLDYQEIGLDCFEEVIRDNIGVVFKPDDDILECINTIKQLNFENIFYFENADAKGTKELIKIVEKYNQ